MKKLVLASRSPRRRQLLKTLGVNFIAAESGFHEIDHADGTPGQHVQDNALGKARAAAARYKNALIIGADTVVVYRQRVLGKPKNMAEAMEYLQLLQGKTHAVYTGLGIIDTKENITVVDFEKTLVTMRSLNEKEIRAYLSRIKPLDKAGAYAIQGAGAIIVNKIAGCYYNVVGFPLAKLEEMLLRLKITLFDYMNTNNKRG
ncbi:MAG: Maf family protein [Proteobacteria bacterium]|nr:Maf family protein [Pseudomonadota bacterium]